MIERLKFWLKAARAVPFHYEAETGNGYALESYNPFTGTARVRLSRFGNVTGFAHWKKSQWDLIGSKIEQGA